MWGAQPCRDSPEASLLRTRVTEFCLVHLTELFVAAVSGGVAELGLRIMGK